MAVQHPEDEYIRYVGTEIPYAARHDGMLRPVAGARHVQVLRANRRHPEWADGFGHTYHHAPNLVFWEGRFFCHWLSNQVSEHIGRSHTLLSISRDGVEWGMPQVLFPFYPLRMDVENGPCKDMYTEETAYACMHQRMGFYVAPDGRLLALGYYGLAAEVGTLPCVGTGIGRVVREIHPDGSFGDIHFLLLNHSGGYNENNILYPMFHECGDAGFVTACRALLDDKLVMQQMWEENRDCGLDLFAVRGAGEAFNHYTLPDGTAVGLWKHSKVSLSHDNGHSWLPVKKCPSLVMSGGKIWGQRTAEDQYALCYNPVTDSCHRWPLAVVTSKDGLSFDRMLCAMGEVGPQRYWGFWRDYGPQYIRGLECDTQAPDGNVWLTYSMNKEDIWVTCLAAPITETVLSHGKEDFNSRSLTGILPDWHLYSPKWAQVGLVEHPVEGDPERKALRLRHRDPADCCKAIRIFPESRKVCIRFTVETRQNYFGRMEVDVMDARGLAVFRMILDRERTIRFKHGNGHAPVGLYGWGMLEVTLSVDCGGKTVDASVILSDGSVVGQRNMRFFGNAATVERLEFRVGVRRNAPVYDFDGEFAEAADLPDADEPLAQEAVYYIHTFETSEFEDA